MNLGTVRMRDGRDVHLLLPGGVRQVELSNAWFAHQGARVRIALAAVASAWPVTDYMGWRSLEDAGYDLAAWGGEVGHILELSSATPIAELYAMGATAVMPAVFQSLYPEKAVSAHAGNSAAEADGSSTSSASPNDGSAIPSQS